MIWSFYCSLIFYDLHRRYVRIVGTHNTVNKVFHLVAFECMFTHCPFTLDGGLLGKSRGAFHIWDGSTICQQILMSAVPTENVATVAACASVVEGVSRSRNALLNGDTRNYDWDSGYTCHQLGSGAIVIQLAQPFSISSLRYVWHARTERSLQVVLFWFKVLWRVSLRFVISGHL